MNPRSFLRFIPWLLLAACSSNPAPQVSPLAPNPLVLNVPRGQNATGTVSFQNTGDAFLTYTATASTWLTLTPANGSVPPGGSATLSVQTFCGSAGTFDGFVTVSSNAGNGAQSTSVQLTCTEAPPPQQGGYNIEVRTSGSGFTPSRQAAFTQAAARVGQLHHGRRDRYSWRSRGQCGGCMWFRRHDPCCSNRRLAYLRPNWSY